MAWNLTPRTTSSLPIAVRENELDHSYDFVITRDADVYGLQMSVNSLGINLVAGQLPMDDASLASDKDGFTNLSWGQSNPVQLKAGEVLFTLENLPAGMPLEQIIVQGEDALYPEIYTEALENEQIELVPMDRVESVSTFESRISPNPFTDVTTLHIVIPAGETFVVTLHDMKGEELYNRKYVSYTNESEVVIGSDIISIPGVYYYRVKSNRGELSGKFVRQ